MAEQDLENNDIIYKATEACLVLLESLGKRADSSTTLQVEKTDGDLSQDPPFLEDMARSFNIWINYTGALADPSRCLDFRLKDHDDIRDMILELLQMLERNLEYVQIGDADPKSASEAITAMQQTLEELHFLANAIRRSSVRSQNFALSSASAKSGDPFFENSAVLIVRNTFRAARRSLCKQIGVSLAVRRTRLVRQARHEERLSTRRQTTQEPALEVQLPGDPIDNTESSPSKTRPVLVTAKVRDFQTRSVDTMSLLDASVARRHIQRGPTLSTISMGSSVRLSSRTYPPMPSFSDGDEYCQCPYCGRRLPTKKMKESTFWSEHLDEDIQPYVCLSEECIAPLLFFASMKQWIDHMSSMHSNDWNRKIHMSTWYCDIGHAKIPFNDLEGLEGFTTHMKNPESHPNQQPPSASQLDTLSRTKQEVLEREKLYVCPLCECVPDKLKPVNQDTIDEKVLHELHKHIASHIKDLAPLSLPGIDATDECGDAVSEADDQERGRWLKEGEKISYPSGFDEEMRALSCSFSSGGSPHILLPEEAIEEMEGDIPTTAYEASEVSAPPTGSWDFVFKSPEVQAKQRAYPSLDNDQTIIRFRAVRNATNARRLPQTSTVHPGNTYKTPVSPDRGAEALTWKFIKTNMVHSKRRAHMFLPEGILAELVNKETVSAVVESLGWVDENKEDVVAWICKEARKIFAVLVFMNQPHLIDHFHNCRFGDDKLPVTFTEATTNAETISTNSGQLALSNTPFSDDIWDENLEIARDDFIYEQQWYFLSPIFREDQFHYTFHENIRLPFIDDGPRSYKKSNFSVVEEWRIHRDHFHVESRIGLTNTTTDNPTVAVKEMKRLSLNESEFLSTVDNEVKVLEMLRRENHIHLIRAIAYYTWRKRHFLMFPWAGLGSLRDFWKDNPQSLTPVYLEWVFRQLCGLADGMERLHNAAGDAVWRHGDLKPENILCFENAGISGNSHAGPCNLVITDVGLTSVHHRVTEARKDATRHQSGTIMYEPPETELHKTEPRSRRYDLWSLGCIYLEFTIWLLYGSEELERFRRDLGEERRFYSIKGAQKAASSTPQLHDKVQRWVDWMRDDDRCSQYSAVRHLIELIVTRLLVPEVGGNIASSSDGQWTLLGEPPSAHSKDSLPTIPRIVRVSTSCRYFEFSDSSLYGNRATTMELNEKMQQIYHDATSKENNRIEWIDWDAPYLSIRKGPPEREGHTLRPSDPQLAARSG
ncbi:hypothetical protein BDV96DRAFT_607675 [Lophiotrema nucula]|uniref:Protein kinase domain-containing protein n=1 Tax=Lophiotrema nucula TaxID=690887 RepID=A0A6A5YGA8_9PLEO|nr:hypothetical protein BDV96DRAFT_607675 [Lophiotrema nucula]